MLGMRLAEQSSLTSVRDCEMVFPIAHRKGARSGFPHSNSTQTGVGIRAMPPVAASVPVSGSMRKVTTVSVP